MFFIPAKMIMPNGLAIPQAEVISVNFGMTFVVVAMKPTSNIVSIKTTAQTTLVFSCPAAEVSKVMYNLVSYKLTFVFY